jgi:diguanylate cyclase (GGDEF)-like protein
MTIQIHTHGDVLRHTARRAGLAAGLTIVMTTTMLILAFGTDLDARVSVGFVIVFSLCAAISISSLLSGALSYRSALLMQELTLTRSELSRISQTDQLTQLLNRRGFDEAAALALRAAQHAGLSAVVFMCDIDHFKAINDKFGHDVGDRVLVEIAGVLRQFAREDGTLVARHGGEEFAVLLIGAGEDVAQQYAESIRRACAAQDIAMGETASRVTISIGFAVCRGAFDLPTMMRSADQALYAAKRRGRDRVVQADAPPLVPA